MVYRIQADLRFPTAAARTAARNTFATAVAGRTLDVIGDTTDQEGSVRTWTYEAESGSAIDGQFAYTQLAAISTALVGSRAYWHACYHGDRVEHCVVTGEKVW